MAEELTQFAKALEKSKDVSRDAVKLVKKTVAEHKRIIFNGDGYSEDWVKEAKRRGLLNLKATVDALPHYMADKNIKLFTGHKIYTKAEMEARYETNLEEYAKTLNIEGLTLSEMVRRDVIPAVSAYLGDLAKGVKNQQLAV